MTLIILQYKTDRQGAGANCNERCNLCTVINKNTSRKVQRRILNDGGNLVVFLFRTLNIPEGPESVILDTTRQEQLKKNKKEDRKKASSKGYSASQRNLFSLFVRRDDDVTAYGSGP